MKMNTTKAIAAGLLGLAFATTSCGNKNQPTSSAPASPGQEVEIKLHCSGSEY